MFIAFFTPATKCGETNIQNRTDFMRVQCKISRNMYLKRVRKYLWQRMAVHNFVKLLLLAKEGYDNALCEHWLLWTFIQKIIGTAMHLFWGF